MSIFNKMAPYFNFTPKEQKGVVVLSVLLLFVIIVRITLPYIFRSNTINEFTVEEIQFFEEKEAEQSSNQKLFKKTYRSELAIDTTLSLNPNLASHSDLLKLGFSDFSATNLIKYRKKGGRFYNVDDLSSIYGVDNSHLQNISANLIFDTLQVSIVVKENSFQLICINTSDAKSLTTIPCVGPVISKRIIKYRKLLGGYYSLKQLKEVYGIDSICLNTIIKYVEVDSSKLNKMNLNTLSEKEFATHPYITLHQAKAIVKYREIMAPFDSLEQLTDSYIFTHKDLQKVASYFSCKPI